MSGFDELVERLLHDVALCGTHGLTTYQLEATVRGFYDNQNTATAVSLRDVPTGADLLFSEKPPSCRTTVDDNLLESVLEWLSRNPDVEIRDVNDANNGDNASTSDQVNRTPSAFQVNHGGKRVFTSEERMWQAITGHGVDHKRVPAREFEILCIVAAHGPAGVLQPSVTKLTGQDKRSVPKRTDMLAEKDYIVKESVVGAGTRTSILKLKRYETTRAMQLADPSQLESGKESTLKPFVYYDTWFDKTMQILKDNDNIVALSDLRKRLGIENVRLEVRMLCRCMRRLAESGCVRRLVAGYQDVDGSSLTRQRTGVQRKVKAVQLLREPTEFDRLRWRLNDPKDKKLSKEDFSEDEVENPDTYEDDAAASGDEGELIETDDEQNDLGFLQERPIPQWIPEASLNNQVYEAVENAGQQGITSMDLTSLLTGPLFRRPLDEVITRLTEIGQRSQPPHLKHLRIVRDTIVHRKKAIFQYRTLENFERAVKAKDVASENAETIKQARKGKKQALELDGWGFPTISLKDLASRDGRATLAEAIKHVQGRPLETIQEVEVVEAQASGIAVEVDEVEGGATASADPIVNTAVSETPKGSRKRKRANSRTFVRTTPQRDKHASTPTPTLVQSPGTKRGPYSMKSPLERPSVKVWRKREISQEEYEAYEKTAQVAAERQVMYEVMARKKRSAVEVGLDDLSERCAKEARLSINRKQEIMRDIPEDRVSQVKADLLARRKPGIYVNPPGARSLKLENYVSRGRPRKMLIAVIKSDGLKGFSWFQDDGPRFAPMSSKSSEALVTHVSEGSRRRKQLTRTTNHSQEIPSNTTVLEDVEATLNVRHRDNSTLLTQSEQPKVTAHIAPEPCTDLQATQSSKSGSRVDKQGHEDVDDSLKWTTHEADTIDQQDLEQAGAAECHDQSELHVLTFPETTSLLRSEKVTASNSEAPTTTFAARIGSAQQHPGLPTSSATITAASPLTVVRPSSEIVVQQSSLKPARAQGTILDSDPVILAPLEYSQHQHYIFNAIRSCNGIFPGDAEPWHVSTTICQRLGMAAPDRLEIDHVVKTMVESRMIKKLTLRFKSKKGSEVKRFILAEPGIDPHSAPIKRMQQEIISAYPGPYLPLEADINDEIRRSVEKKHATLETSEGSGKPGSLHKSAFARSQDITVRKLIQRATPDKSRKQIRRVVESNVDKDGSDHEEIDPQQAAMQSKFQLETYQHDVSLTEPQCFTANDWTSRTVRFDTIDPQDHHPSAATAWSAQKPMAKARVLSRRPMSALRFSAAHRRSRDVEGGMTLDDIVRHRREAASMLLHPARSLHEPTGTFGTSGLVNVEEELEHRALPRHLLRDPHHNFNGSLSQQTSSTFNRFASLNEEELLDPKASGNAAQGYLVSAPTNLSSMTPSAAKPKRRYKSIGKRTLVNDDLGNPDGNFMPEPETRPRNAAARYAATYAAQREITGRDRKTPSLFKDADRLVIAWGLVNAICGGINQDRLSWTLIAHALSFRYDPDFLRRRWGHIRRERKPDAERVRDSLREPFLQAYQNDELPTIDFSDLNKTDWPAVFDWAEYTVGAMNVNQRPDLPKLSDTREEIERHYDIQDPERLFELSLDDYFTTGTDTNRKHLALRYNYSTPLSDKIRPIGDLESDLLLAKSWVRAVAMTKQRNYDADVAAAKLQQLGESTLLNVSAQMVDSKLFSQDRKGRHLPGRNFQIHLEVLAPFRRWPAKPEEHQYLRTVAHAWSQIRNHFRTHDEMTLIPAASDQAYLVLTNMAAHGMLRVVSVLPDINNDYDAPYPRLSPWGYGPPGYETKKVDTSVLKFPIIYKKTESYVSDHGLKIHVPIPMQPALVRDEIGHRIPFWVDIHGNLLDEIWDMVLRSIVHLVVFRPGCTATYMESAHNHKFWAWEIDMVLQWMEMVGIVCRTGVGEEIDGVWKGGWRADVWWFCAFIPEIAKWHPPLERDVGVQTHVSG